jgi:hypothetical protein
VSDQLESKYRYLVQATNRMFDLTGDAERQPVGNLAQAAAQAAAALDQLLEDRHFSEDLERWARLDGALTQEQGQLIEALEVLATTFMRVEKQALLDTGHSEQATEDILWAAARFLRNVEGPIDPKKIKGNIMLLRNACRDASEALYGELDAKKRKKVFETLALGMGGVSLTWADTAAAIPSGGASALSIKAGTAMVGAAVGAFIAHFKKRPDL